MCQEQLAVQDIKKVRGTVHVGLQVKCHRSRSKKYVYQRACHDDTECTYTRYIATHAHSNGRQFLPFFLPSHQGMRVQRWPAESKIDELMTIENGPFYGSARSGIPTSGRSSYFYAMLFDMDRAKLYREAIFNCIQKFHADHQRFPAVIDVGAGTGLLTFFVLESFQRLNATDFPDVQAIEVNETHLREAEDNIANCADLRPEYKKKASFRLTRLARGEKVPADLQAFDMIVSELLGSFTTSENAFAYIGDYFKSDKRRKSGYVVPCETFQYVSVYCVQNIPSPARLALENGIREMANNGRSCPTNDDGLAVQLDAYPLEMLLRKELLVENYSGPKAERRLTRSLEVSEFGRAYTLCGPDDVVLLSLEFEALLWPGVARLKNTLDGYREIRHQGDAMSALARNSAWGVFLLPAFPSGALDPGKFEVHLNPTDIGSTMGMDRAKQPAVFDTEELQKKRRRKDDSDEDDSDGDDSDEDDSDEDDSDPNLISNIRYAFDTDFSERLASLCVQEVVKRSTPITRVLVWEDMTCGMLPHSIRVHLNQKEELKSVTVAAYSQHSVDAATALNAQDVKAFWLKTDGRITRSARGLEVVRDLGDLSRTLVVCPRDLLTNQKNAFSDVAKTDVAKIPAAPPRLLHARYALKKSPSMSQYGGSDFGTLRYLLGSDEHIEVFVRKCAAVAFLMDFDDGEQDACITLNLQEVREQDSMKLPTLSLPKLQELAQQGKWASLQARACAVPRLKFSAFKCKFS